MKCSKVRERLSLYIDGELDERSAAEIRSHTGECSDCGRELAAMRSLICAAREVELAEPPIDIARRIREAVAAEQRSGIGCDAALELISAYVDGELRPEDRGRVESHTAACGRCEAELRATAAIARGASEIESIEPPAGLRARIAAAVDAARPQSPLDRIAAALRSPRAVRWAAGAAAAAVIVVAVIVATPWTPQPVQTAAVERKAPAPSPSSLLPMPPAPNATAAASVQPEQMQKARGARIARHDRDGGTRPEPTAEASAPDTRPFAPVPPTPPIFEEPELTAERPDLLEELDTVDTAPQPEPIQVAVAPAPAIEPDKRSASQPTLMKVASAPAIENDDYEEWFARVKDRASVRGATRRNVSVDLFSARF